MQSPASFSQVFGSSEVLTKNNGLLALHGIIRNLLIEPSSDPTSIAQAYQRAEKDVAILKRYCTELDVEYHFCGGETAKARMGLTFFKSLDFKSVEATQHEVKACRTSTAETRLVRRVGTIHRGGSCVIPSDTMISNVPIVGSRGAGGVFKHLYFLCCDGVYRNALREPVPDKDLVIFPDGPAERELKALSRRLYYYGLQMYKSGGAPLPVHFSDQYKFVFSSWSLAEDGHSYYREGIEDKLPPVPSVVEPKGAGQKKVAWKDARGRPIKEPVW